jgi:enoyl-CoA hydratase
MSLISTEERGILTLQIDNPPAHALSKRLVSELGAALDGLQKAQPRALILTSSGERFFSAGLDLIELYGLERPAIEAFSRELQQMFLRIFRFPFPVVAALNGHAIAGGAVLALTADRRLLARGDHLFGLNEVQVGLPLPGALFEIVRGAMGAQHAPEALLEGKNFGVDDALRVGFVHEVVERSELFARAFAIAEKLAQVSGKAYQRMKELLHADAESRMARWLESDPFVEIWFQDETRRAMGKARERLLRKK